MNKLKLFNAGINTKEGIARFNDNEALYEKWLFDFPKDNNYKLMLQAIKNEDVQRAYNHAHTLKGISGNLSMNRLYEKVCVLVEQLKEKNITNIDKILQEVDTEYQLIINALKGE